MQSLPPEAPALVFASAGGFASAVAKQRKGQNEIDRVKLRYRSRHATMSSGSAEYTSRIPVTTVNWSGGQVVRSIQQGVVFYIASNLMCRGGS